MQRSVDSAAPGGRLYLCMGHGSSFPAGSKEVSVPSAHASLLDHRVCQLFQAVARLWKVTASFFLLPASCTNGHIAKRALLPLADLLNLNILLTAGSDVCVLCTSAERQARRDVKPRIIKDISDRRS